MKYSMNLDPWKEQENEDIVKLIPVRKSVGLQILCALSSLLPVQQYRLESLLFNVPN